MEVDIKQQIGCGYYGHVFKLEETNSVIKIFHKHDDVDECWIRKIYSFEKKAYEIAQNSEILKQYIPTYYGPKHVSQIVDNGIDISSDFYLDFNFSMAFLEGELSEVRNLIPDEKFMKEGLCGLDDYSVFIKYSPPKIIDFSTKKVEKFQTSKQGGLFKFTP